MFRRLAFSLASALALALLTFAAAPVRGADLLLVVADNAALSSDESARKTTFEGWGHTVTTIDDSDSQTNFDTALASADVVYVNAEVDYAQIAYKLRTTTVGVVHEAFRRFDSYMGWTTSLGASGGGGATSITIDDNTHPITAGLGSSLTIFNSSSDSTTARIIDTRASGVQTLASQTSSAEPILGVIETGATLANTYSGNSTASGRRVRLPFAIFSSFFKFSWSNLSAGGLQLISDSIDWAAGGSGGGSTGNVLLVTAGASPTSEESARLAEFEGWGFTVSTIDDSASQSAFNTTLAANDVVYVSAAAAATSLDYKLRKAKIGVVHEGVSSWDDNVGWTTSTGQQANTCTTMTVVDNTHPISEHFSTGTVTIFNSSSGSNGAQVAGTIAIGAEVLANNRCINSGSPNLLVMEIGSALANTYDGNSTAAGRRVRLPFGGFGVPSWSNVSADGLTMVRSALEWASSDGLLLHWKLDDASGTTAEDSSGNGNDGTLTGSQAWTTGKDGGAHTFDYTDGTDDYFQAPSTPELNDVNEGDYTLMAYVKPNSLPPGTGSNNTANYGILIKEGYHVGLIYTSEGRFQFDHYLAGSTWSGTATWDDAYAPGQWYHVAGVVSRAEGTVKIFVDGQLKFTDTFTAGTAGADRGSAPWRVGIGGPGFSNWRWAADADIDDARIYNRALSDEEISQFVNFGLVGHWQLDEASGTVAVDSGPSGADGTYENGVALDQGGPYPGVTAAAFDGSNDHVELPTLNANFQSGLTIAAWVQPDATLGSGEFHEILDLSNGSQVDQILLSYNGAAGLQLFLTDTVDGSSIRTIEDNKGFTAGRWVHCVATIDSSGYGKIYRNGQVTKSGFFTSLPTNVSRGTATIGKSSFGDHFGGGLYDVRLYNYELTEAEIAEIYGLVGHWKFDETSGTLAVDSSGAGNDGVHYGTPTVDAEGVRERAYTFGASGTYLQVAASSEIKSINEAGGSWSVALWVKPNSEDYEAPLVFRGGNVVDNAPGIWINSAGTIRWQARNAAGGGNGRFNSNAKVSQGRWTQIVAIKNGLSMSMYVDGVLDHTGTLPAASVPNSYPLQIGKHLQTPGISPDADIDDVQLYNRAMTEAEIAEHHGLVGHWKMEEVSGSVVSDSSGAGNHGEIVGTADWSADAKEAFGALELDGTNYVEVPGLIVSDTTDGVTVAGWAKLSDADTEGAEFVSLGDAFGIRLDDPYGGEYGSQAFAYHGSNWDSAKSGINHANSGWRHFAAVFDPSALEIKLYIDGVLRVTTPATGPPVMSGLGSNTILGRHADGDTDRDFTGLMDDIRVYNRMITRAEARTLFYGEYTPGLRIIKWVEVANP